MTGIKLNNKNLKLPNLALMFIAVSVATLVLYMIFSIIPGYGSIKKIRQDIKMANADLSVLEKIIPVFAKAKQIDGIALEPGLSFSRRAELDREKLPGLLNVFQSLALKHNLLIIDNKLDTTFLSRKPGSVSILFKSQGRLQDFRAFLVSIISLPYFETVETINIHPDSNGLNNFTINFKINIETKHESS